MKKYPKFIREYLNDKTKTLKSILNEIKRL